MSAQPRLFVGGRSSWKKGAVVALLLPLLVGFTGRETTYDFKTLPKSGDQSDFKESVKLALSGQDVTVDTILHQVLDTVLPTGEMRVTQTETATVVKVGGQPANPPDSKPQVLSYGANGELKEAKVDGADANFYRLFNLSVFLKPDGPVKVGASWTKTLPANKTTGTVPVRAVYTIVGPEKVGSWDTVKVTFKINETDVDTPASGDGTFWIGLKDSQIVKEIVNFHNAVFPGLPNTPVEGSSTMERIH